MAEAKKEAKKQGFFSKAGPFFRSCIGEMKKITWPTPKQTTKNFLMVIAVIAVSGLFIYALDRGLYALLNLVMSTGTQ